MLADILSKKLNYYVMLSHMNSTQWAQSGSNHKIGVIILFSKKQYIL